MGDTVPAVKGFTGSHRFLSNFYPAPVTYCGLVFPSVENAYQAAKFPDLGVYVLTAMFVDPARTPGDAKKLARSPELRGRMRPDWDVVRFAVMDELVTAKFANPALRAQLAATGGAALVEVNKWHDQTWGDCRCGKRPECAAPGLNALGRILEAVRGA